MGRASSITGAAYDALKQRGVRVEAADLTGPEDDLVKLLTGVDVVISTIVFTRLYDQIHLAKAAKRAGVKRFVPSDFGTPTARGVMRLHNHVRIHIFRYLALIQLEANILVERRCSRGHPTPALTVHHHRRRVVGRAFRPSRTVGSNGQRS